MADWKRETIMRVSICVGNYAAVPYVISELGVSVYCMEELCYALKENAFLLDATLMSDRLVDWIEGECGLKDLAHELYPMVHKQGKFSAFIIMIMDYAGLYEDSVLREMEEVLRKGAGLSGIEKRKGQIDYLVEKKKYAAALRGYDALLAQWRNMEGETPGKRIYAAILHNRGVALTRLMLYEQAAESFRLACETEPAKEHYMAHLAAKRMELSEEEYISYAAELTSSYEASLALERELELLESDFVKQPEYKKLLLRREWRQGIDKQKYYDENDSLTQSLKSTYRSSVSE